MTYQMEHQERMMLAGMAGVVTEALVKSVMDTQPQCPRETALGMVVAQCVRTALWYPEWGEMVAALVSNGDEAALAASMDALVHLLPMPHAEAQL